MNLQAACEHHPRLQNNAIVLLRKCEPGEKDVTLRDNKPNSGIYIPNILSSQPSQVLNLGEDEVWVLFEYPISTIAAIYTDRLASSLGMLCFAH
jgi:hypothetical protein